MVHALGEERPENTKRSPQHEAPILAAPLGEETNYNIEPESEPGQTVPRVTTPVDGRPPMPRTSSEEAQNSVPPESEKIAKSVDESSKTTSPDAPSLPAHNNEATQIQKALLKEYARNASESDQREHDFYAKQLDSQLIFAGIFSAVVVQLIPQTYPMLQVPSPNASAIAINAGFFGSLVLSLCTAIMSLQCRAWLDGYQAPATETPTMRSLRHVASGSMIRRADAHLRLLRIFFIGLVVFLLTLHVPIAIAIIVLLGTFLVGHILTNIIPSFTTEAPYRTPLSQSLGALYRGARKGQMPSQQLNELAETADVRKQQSTLDREILSWLAVHAKRTAIQESAEEFLALKRGPVV
ncbi:hypothetical protein FB451DRAFT_1192393 [Mycena latifolia]|nr:hypothetical protein FB451DRAFT_1192393 [Mycena latifolia]